MRHRDDSGDSDTEWSQWSERRFRTAPASPAPPLLVRDFLTDPAPRWTRSDGRPVELPPGATLSLEAADGERLLDLHEGEGAIAVSDALPFAAHVAVRVVLSAQGGVWTLPESELSLYDGEGVEHTRSFSLPSCFPLRPRCTCGSRRMARSMSRRQGSARRISRASCAARRCRGPPGFNYGWDGTEDSMTIGAICSFPEGSAPVNVAFVQRETFGGSGFPEEKMDRAFVTESGPTWASGTPVAGKRISEVAVNLDGTLESGPSMLLRYDGTGKATVAGLAAGPDGLYFTSLYRDFGYTTPADRGAAVFRVRWTGYADFLLRVGMHDPLRVKLTDNSAVADAESRHWDFGDGTGSSERSPIHSYARPGSWLVTLTVTRGGETFVVRKRIHLTGGGAGLRAQYFPTADYTGPGVRRIDEQIDWDDELPLPFASEEFSVRWSGHLVPRVSEPHRFVVESSGEARLWIDGHEVHGEVPLEAGRRHDIVLEYVHRGGPPQMRLSWESETQPLAVVPPSVLFAPAGTKQRAVRN